MSKTKVFPTFDQLFRAADVEARDLLLGSGIDPLASGGDPAQFLEAVDRITEHTQAYFAAPEDPEDEQRERERCAREYAAFYVGLALGCRLNAAP